MNPLASILYVSPFSSFAVTTILLNNAFSFVGTPPTFISINPAFGLPYGLAVFSQSILASNVTVGNSEPVPCPDASTVWFWS